MSELIDKAKLLKYIAAIKPDEYVSAYGEAVVDVINHVETYVNEVPTIEPEVRHGRWQWAKGYVGTMAECSVCGSSPMSFYSLPKNQIGRLPVYKYCPRCGAKMDIHSNQLDL